MAAGDIVAEFDVDTAFGVGFELDYSVVGR